eukprot:PhF_6_TR32289/c0_g1_i1/m.47918
MMKDGTSRSVPPSTTNELLDHMSHAFHVLKFSFAESSVSSCLEPCIGRRKSKERHHPVRVKKIVQRQLKIIRGTIFRNKPPLHPPWLHLDIDRDCVNHVLTFFESATSNAYLVSRSVPCICENV